MGEEELFLGKTWKLNAERNNGRAAMMGITGTLLVPPRLAPALSLTLTRLGPRPRVRLRARLRRRLRCTRLSLGPVRLCTPNPTPYPYPQPQPYPCPYPGMLIHESLTGNPVFPIGEQL